MTIREHVRALLRFIGPWSEQGEGIMLSYCILTCITLVYACVAGDGDVVRAWCNLLGYILGARITWRLLFVIASLFSRALRREFKQEWRMAGERRILDSYLTLRDDRQKSYAFLRMQGMSRKDARDFARSCVTMRRTSRYMYLHSVPWRLEK